MPTARWILYLVLSFILWGAMGAPIEARQPEDKSTGPSRTRLQMTLKNGSAEQREVVPTHPAIGTALAPGRATEILRMFAEPLQQQGEQASLFNRSTSQPPPASSRPTRLPFPAPVGPAAPAAPESEAKALKLLSITPQGATARVPRVSVVFSNPMRAVGDPKEVGDPMGISLEPRPRGSWRWLGTQTVIFEPEGGELPRATEYRVTVSSGITDITGNTLAAPVSQPFVLSRPKVEASSPQTSGISLEPVLTVKFDQPVVRESALRKIHLQKAGRRVPIRELSVVEAEARQSGIEEQCRLACPDTLFLFAPSESLAPGSSYKLVIDSGVQSQEGPLTMEQAYSSSFSTYETLKLSPPDPKNRLGPSNSLHLKFNNELDRSSLGPDLVTVTPEIPDMQVRVYGSSLAVLGRKEGNTNYKVTVSGRLSDKFGQKLGEPVVANFLTDHSSKALFYQHGLMSVLDPTVSTSLSFFSTNVEKVDMEVRRVEPKDWVAYSKLVHGRRASVADHSHEQFPGTELEKTSLTLGGRPDTLTETRLNLSEYLDDGKGNLIVLLTDPTADKETRRYRQIITWVQATSLGLDLEVSQDQVVALVTKLQDAKPLAGAQVKVGSQSGLSKEDGTAQFLLPAKPAAYTIVTTAKDQAFLPGDPRPIDDSPDKESSPVNGHWLLFSDRGLYRPGETAHIKGYVRKWVDGPPSKLKSIGQPGQIVRWELHGHGNKPVEGQAKLSSFGTIDFTVDLPKDIELGRCYLTVHGDGLPKGYLHDFDVDEFRRPEFEVNMEVLSAQPHLLQSSATVKARASYYAGGPLAGAQVDWYVGGEDASYTPPGRSDYTFGQWTPWWDMGPWWPQSYDPFIYEEFAGRANSSGEHSLEIGFDRLYPPRPSRVTIGASVSDVNNQRQRCSSTVLVHPSTRYVGLKSEKSFVDEKSGFELEAIVTDIDGNIVPVVPITISLLEIRYELDEMDIYRQLEKLSQQITVSSAEAPVKIQLAPTKGGSYRIRAEVVDEEGRPNRTDYTMWKAGGMMPTQGKVELEPLTLVPDRKEYTPGQTAKVLVVAPFAEGEGLVVWARDGLIKEERFTLDDGSATLQYPLTEELVPNLHAKVTVVGKTQWGQGTRPAVAAGDLSLAISHSSRKLSVELLPQDANLEPGSEVELQARVKDVKGQPVSGCEVTLWMADESVLDLAGYVRPRQLSSPDCRGPGLPRAARK